ncbi:delta-60 repeat domain-containing protein [Aquimonas voraii]|uniref:Delta-60 repeat domain-containing protein n=1 Tax=Aquimonas voraii TaxID=265719 RepID=A0A1G6X5D4_9GAMM|nr:delta-60 repeat domain-containing protein [Aquimonas voraii]SDD73329.1 delta-60 repeat domain-containing protein [Aquimonas voraii]
MSIRSLLAVLFLILCMPGPQRAAAQSARDGWAPVLDASAEVQALLDAGDGRVYVAARFDGTTSALRRFNPDGSPDTSFPEAVRGADIHALAVVDGRVWVGGFDLFTGGSSRGALVVLDAQGAVLPAFPARFGRVHAIEPDGSGGAFVGGEFSLIDNSLVRLIRTFVAEDGDFSLHPDQPQYQGRTVLALKRVRDGGLIVGSDGLAGSGTPSSLVRLHPSGSPDPGFKARITQEILDIEQARNGDLLVAGNFFSVNGENQTSYTRLRADGSLSPDNLSLPIGCCASRVIERRNGEVLVAGNFLSQVAGTDRLLRIPLLRSNGAVGPLARPDGQNVRELLELADGSVLVGGRFSTLDGVEQRNLGRVRADGTVDAEFRIQTDTGVFTTLASFEDGVWLGGDFTQLNGVAVGRLVKLDHRGRRAPASSHALNRVPLALLPLDNDRLLVGGDFTQVGAQVASHLLLIENSSGGRLPLSIGADNTVHALARQADGKILIGGAFASIGGVARRAIARLNADLSLDTGFNLLMDSTAVVRAIAVSPDGGIVLGGSFGALGIESRQNLAKVRADGSIQALFTPNPNGRVDSLLIAPNGEVYVGGTFTSIGGQARSRVARLEADGSLGSFAPTVNAGTTRVSAVALQADGRVLLGGNGGLLKRVEAGGANDPGWSLSFTGSADGLSLGSDGRLWVIGSFASIAGEPRQGIARIAPPDRHASQAFAYSDVLRRLFWGVRSTAPEVAGLPRASLSLDRGQSFTPLPAMVRQSSLWRSTLMLPLDTEVLVRIEAEHAAAPAGSGLGQLHSELLLFQSSALFGSGFE